LTGQLSPAATNLHRMACEQCIYNIYNYLIDVLNIADKTTTYFLTLDSKLCLLIRSTFMVCHCHRRTQSKYSDILIGASFSYNVSITIRVIISTGHISLHKTRKFGFDWVKWKRDTCIQISKEMYERGDDLSRFHTFLCKFWTFWMLVFRSNFVQTAPNFGMGLKKRDIIQNIE